MPPRDIPPIPPPRRSGLATDFSFRQPAYRTVPLPLRQLAQPRRSATRGAGRPW
jgi:hypothetical protein